MRARLLSIGTVSRVGGALAVAAAIVATSVQFRNGHVSAGSSAGMASSSVRDDPLAHELVRCRAIGMAARDDAACEAAWAENRRRFFNDGPPSDRTASTPAVQPSAATPEER